MKGLAPDLKNPFKLLRDYNKPSYVAVISSVVS